MLASCVKLLSGNNNSLCFLNAYKALKWPSTPKLASVLYNMESKIPENFESGHGRLIAAPAKGFQLLETLSEFDCFLRHLVLQFIAC